MEKKNGLKKLIDLDYKMSWKALLLYTVVTSAVVALLNSIPALKDTAFTMPAVTLEAWFILALVIILNADSLQNAVLKTFVFFLIGQPLIYLIEAPFNRLGLGLFQYYKYWFYITLLTPVGAAIAYQVKRRNALSYLILSVATVYVTWTAIDCLLKSKDVTYPIYAVLLLFFTYLIIRKVYGDEKKKQVIEIVITVALAVLVTLYANVWSPENLTKDVPLGDGNWEIYEISGANAEITDGSTLTVHYSMEGEFTVSVQNEAGEIREFVITEGNRSIDVTER